MPAVAKRQSNQSLFRDFVDYGLNHATPDAVERLVAPDYRDHSLYYPMPANRALRTPNRGDLLAFVNYLAGPDVHLQFTLEDVLGEGDKVAYRLLAEGTIELRSGQPASSESVPRPTYLGKSSDETSNVSLTYAGAGMASFSDGLLIENWGINAVRRWKRT